MCSEDCAEKGYCIKLGQNKNRIRHYPGDSEALKVLGQTFTVEYHTIDYLLRLGYSTGSIMHDLMGTERGKRVCDYTSKEKELYNQICARRFELRKPGGVHNRNTIAWKQLRDRYQITKKGHSNPIELLSDCEWSMIFRHVKDRKLKSLSLRTPKNTKDNVIHGRVLQELNARKEKTLDDIKSLKRRLNARNSARRILFGRTR